MESSENPILRSRSFEAKCLELPKLCQINVVSECDFEKKDIKNLISSRNPEAIQNSKLDEWSYFDLEYARVEDLETCMKFIEAAAKTGDNVGEDEAESNDIRNILVTSEVFLLKSPGRPGGSKRTKAFITIQPYLGSRSEDRCQTLLVVYYEPSWMDESYMFLGGEPFPKDVVYCILTLLGIQLVKDIQVGYTDVVVRVCPATHPHRLRLLQKIGFQFAASIPKGILTKGSLEEDFVLFKNISPPRGPRADEEVIRMIDFHFPKNEVDCLFEERELPLIAILPRFYFTEKALLIRIRPALKEEVSFIYGMFQEATEKYNGYGRNEYPTFSHFKAMFLESYNVIFELTESMTCNSKMADERSIIACSLIHRSWHSRSQKSKIAESSVVINRLHRGSGFAKDVVLYDFLLAKSLGFDSIVNDYLESNAAMSSIIHDGLKSIKTITIGLVPRSNFNANIGWEGAIIHYTNLNDQPFNRLMIEFAKSPVTCYLRSNL